MKEKLLFAALGGSYAGRRAAIIMQDHCLPIACSHKSYGDARATAEFGLHACWEAHTNVEEFFEHLKIEGIKEPNSVVGLPAGWRPEGLYVYEVAYAETEIDGDADDDWCHLAGGTLRRPTADELEPLTLGKAPWGGVVL